MRTGVNLKIGNTVYQTKVYDAELTGHGTDGRFGWNFFEGKIVELNYDLNKMIVYPSLPEGIVKYYSAVKMDIEDGILKVECKIKQNGVSQNDYFLFDIGYQRTIMLDNNLLSEAKFPLDQMKIIKKVVMQGGQGNEIPVITANLEKLSIGKFNLKNIPVQLITSHKPIADKKIHILGNEVLKRFNIIMDFKANMVYLKPNYRFNDHYIDEK